MILYKKIPFLSTPILSGSTTKNIPCYNQTMLLRYIYTLFIGVLFAAFVGFGIEAFYPIPEPPEYPLELRKPYPAKEEDLQPAEKEQLNKAALENEESQKGFEKAYKQHNRNVSAVALASFIVVMVVSFVFLRKILLISDGLLLGGVFSLIYSIVRGFDAGDSMFRFVIVSVGLGVSLVFGYLKFVRGK